MSHHTTLDSSALYCRVHVYIFVITARCFLPGLAFHFLEGSSKQPSPCDHSLAIYPICLFPAATTFKSFPGIWCAHPPATVPLSSANSSSCLLRGEVAMKNPLSSLPFFHGSIIYLHLVFTLQGKKFNNLSKVTKIMNIKDSHHACLQSLEPNGSPSSPNVSETEARGSICSRSSSAT